MELEQTATRTPESGAVPNEDGLEPSPAAAFLRDLVAIPSVHPNEDAAVARFAAEATQLGFAVEIDTVGNAIATRTIGEGRGPQVVLLGHIDTVGGDIPVHVEHGVLRGRGSVDAKGPLAAMLYGAARAEAAEACVIRVIAARGEETPRSPGARYLSDQLRPDACIIGEPSGWDGVTLGYKGRLVVRARFEQEGAHSAGPDGSAADTAHAWWAAALTLVSSLNAEHAPSRESAFDRVQATIRSIRTSSDGLHDACDLEAGFRLPAWIGPEELEERLIALDPHISLRFEGHERCCTSDRSDPVVCALTAAVRAAGGTPRPKRKTGTSDWNVVAPVWRCPIAAYGPGDSSLDHTPREAISLAEFERSIGVVADAVGRVVGALAGR